MREKVKKIAFLGIGIALYFVLGIIMTIPLFAGTHLQTDLGYIAYGAYLVIFGWQACIVGIAGCLLESLLTSGWIPIGWMIGQVVIGLACGIVYKKVRNKWIWIAATVVAVFVGVGLIKTIVECALYGIPFLVKLPKNTIAFVADLIPMLLGVGIGVKMKGKNYDA